MLHPDITNAMARTRAEDLLERAARDRRRVVRTGHRSRLSLPGLLRLLRLKRQPIATDTGYPEVRIRYASPADDAELRQLAALDSSQVPDLPLLVAEVEGQLYAAMSLSDRRAIADPFRHTQALIELLEVRAAQILAANAGLPRFRRSASWKLASDSRKQGL